MARQRGVSRGVERGEEREREKKKREKEVNCMSAYRKSDRWRRRDR